MIEGSTLDSPRASTKIELPVEERIGSVSLSFSLAFGESDEPSYIITRIFANRNADFRGLLSIRLSFSLESRNVRNAYDFFSLLFQGSRKEEKAPLIGCRETR